jgi:hypothetical protein
VRRSVGTVRCGSGDNYGSGGVWRRGWRGELRSAAAPPRGPREGCGAGTHRTGRHPASTGRSPAARVPAAGWCDTTGWVSACPGFRYAASPLLNPPEGCCVATQLAAPLVECRAQRSVSRPLEWGVSIRRFATTQPTGGRVARLLNPRVGCGTPRSAGGGAARTETAGANASRTETAEAGRNRGWRRATTLRRVQYPLVECRPQAGVSRPLVGRSGRGVSIRRCATTQPTGGGAARLLNPRVGMLRCGIESSAWRENLRMSDRCFT